MYVRIYIYICIYVLFKYSLTYKRTWPRSVPKKSLNTMDDDSDLDVETTDNGRKIIAGATGATAAAAGGGSGSGSSSGDLLLSIAGRNYSDLFFNLDCLHSDTGTFDRSSNYLRTSQRLDPSNNQTQKPVSNPSRVEHPSR